MKSSDALNEANQRRKVADKASDPEESPEMARGQHPPKDAGESLTTRFIIEQDPLINSEVYWAEETKQDRGKVKFFMGATGEDATVPANDIFEPEVSGEALIKGVREARQKRIAEGKSQGWIRDKLGGSCCQCDSSMGFSRYMRRCGECRHKFCTLCVGCEEV